MSVKYVAVLYKDDELDTVTIPVPRPDAERAARKLMEPVFYPYREFQKVEPRDGEYARWEELPDTGHVGGYAVVIEKAG